MQGLDRSWIETGFSQHEFLTEIYVYYVCMYISIQCVCVCEGEIMNHGAEVAYFLKILSSFSFSNTILSHEAKA